MTDNGVRSSCDALSEQQGQGRDRGRSAQIHFIPREVAERLNMTDEQRQQMDELEKETKAKLYKILTAEQQQQLEQIRPPRRQSDSAGDDRNPPPADSDNRPAGRHNRSEAGGGMQDSGNRRMQANGDDGPPRPDSQEMRPG